MLQRLSDISKVNLSDFFDDYKQQDWFRYHPIDWAAHKIPIKISDLDWLGEQRHAEDFEMVQFQISTGTGRIIGFFDPQKIFNIVLFDPSHNLQPSKKFDYRVQATHIAECQLSKTIVRIQNAIVSSEHVDKSIKTQMLRDIQEQYSDITGGCIMIDVSDQCLEKIFFLVSSGMLVRMGDVIELAIDDLMDRT